MKLLNVGCGGNRLQDEFWTNLDCLKEALKEGTPERTQLDSEPRYVECNFLSKGKLPFTFNEFDGVLCSHVIEHFDCHQAVALLIDCRAVLKPGGLLVVSVPDADYFLSVHERDTPENAVELFGEPIHDKWQPDFMAYALLHRDHRQVLTESSLRCLLISAGFKSADIFRLGPWFTLAAEGASAERAIEIQVTRILNRQKFSVILKAIKFDSSPSQ